MPNPNPILPSTPLPLMPRRFGVELEAKGLTTREASGALQFAGVTQRHEGNTHNASPGRDEGPWRVVYDGSLSQGFEAVSPPTHSTHEVWNVCRILREAGARVDRQCGTHVHVDATGASIEQLRRVVKLWVRFESVLDSLVPPSRRNVNDYCRSNLTHMGARLGQRNLAHLFANIDGRATAEGLRRYVQGDRFYKLNLRAWWEHGTIEYRMHSGTLNGSKLARWIATCVGLTHFAMDRTDDIPAESGTLDDLIETVGRAMPGVFAQEVRTEQPETRTETREVEELVRDDWTPRRNTNGERMRYWFDMLWEIHGRPTAINDQLRATMYGIAREHEGIDNPGSMRVIFNRWRNSRIGRTVTRTETVEVPVTDAPPREVVVSWNELHTDWYAEHVRGRAAQLAIAQP